jgi:TolB-like protein/Flp pilus assembly protein TadD
LDRGDEETLMLAAGTSLGPYKILAPLGAGGMGEVYRAHDTRLGRDVAIKVLPSHLAAAPEVRARFEREARTISQLNHPHICTLFDVGREGETDYLVMELVEGETLAHRLEKGPLPVADVLSLGRQIAEALDRAHRAGVVHRDLKPGNVMLTKSGAKLMDFGLARAQRLTPVAGALTESPTVSRPLTAEGTIVGTFQYMAPEQLEGKEVDARTDLWSLGCVLYEMATGQRAFGGESQASLISAIMKDEPRPMTEFRPLTPPALEQLVKRCLEKDPEERFQSARDLAFDLGAVSRSTVGTAVFKQARKGPRAIPALVGLAVVVVVASVLLVMRAQRESPRAPAHGRTEIAVLPFQNLSAGGPHTYFAGGLHDELLTQLANVAALKVISRTSVMGYAGTMKPLKQIADELGVGTVVEGTVQVEGERLRVTVQLIDAATDEHLWAERYDRTLNDAFAIQSEVAQRIVAAVGTALTRAEQGRLAAVPTANAEAYRLYLQGREYAARPGVLRQDRETAQRLYERALGLDPSFALAHAALSQVHGETYWWRYDPSMARAARQREEAETALRLAPDLPQAHLAMGLAHYWGRRDYRRALDEFATALKGLPNDAELWLWMGTVHRRLGNWEEVFAAFEKAVQLDPRNADVFWNLGGITYDLTHRYADAVRAFDKALVLAPDLHLAAVYRGRAYVCWRGQLDTLRAVLGRVPRDAELGAMGSAAAQRAELLLWERDANGLLQELQGARVPVFETQHFFLPSALYAAWAHRLRGDEAARAAFDSARALLDSVMKELPDDWRVHVARGLALTGLGRRDEALREASWLQRSEVYRKDVLSGPILAEYRALILAQAGDAEAALDEIERLLAGPSWLTVHTLRLNPGWDPIREHPRFKVLLVKYAQPEAR